MEGLIKEICLEACLERLARTGSGWRRHSRAAQETEVELVEKKDEEREPLDRHCSYVASNSFAPRSFKDVE